MRALWGLFRTAHPFPSFLVAGVTLALALIVAEGESGATVLALGLGMLLYQFAIGFSNDLADEPHDREHNRTKPLVAGQVSRRTVTVAFTLAAGGGALVTWGLEHGAWYVGMAGLLCGLVYNFAFKRTLLSWLPLAIAIPLVPVWVHLALDAWTGLLWWAFPLGATLGLSVHLANQSADADEGLAAALGKASARRTAVGLFGMAGSALAVILVFAGYPGHAAAAAAAASATALVSLRWRRFGRYGLFGLLAGGAGLLGLIYVAALQ